MKLYTVENISQQAVCQSSHSEPHKAVWSTLKCLVWSAPNLACALSAPAPSVVPAIQIHILYKIIFL